MLDANGTMVGAVNKNCGEEVVEVDEVTSVTK